MWGYEANHARTSGTSVDIASRIAHRVGFKGIGSPVKSCWFSPPGFECDHSSPFSRPDEPASVQGIEVLRKQSRLSGGARIA